MTLLKALFPGDEKATTLIPRDDIITSDRLLLGDFGGSLHLGGSIDLAGGGIGTYEEIVRRQLWVRVAVNKLAYTIGRLPLKTYQRDGATRSRVVDSPLAQLLQKPNDSKESGHPSGFKARLAYDLVTFGNALVVKVQTRPDQPPTQLIPFSPRGWSINPDGNYVYRQIDGKEREFQSWRIIHLIEPGPTVNGFGVSRLEAARLTLAIEYAAQRLGVATFNNGARPGGVINVKGGLPSNQQDRAAVMQRFKEEIRRRFGGVENAGLPAVLEGDVSWLSMSHNLDDSAVVDHRQLTRMEVAALFDIPQPAIGILDEANFASVDALHLMFYQDSLGWPIKLIEDAFNQQLIAGVPAFADQYVEFDLNAVMRGSFAQRMQGYLVGINGRIFTPDEVRTWENLPPMADQQPDAGLLQFPLNYGTAPTPPGQGQEGP